jgi:uncharacterized repeat protein (TIGR03847 family)
MHQSFELDDIAVFTTGAIGPMGLRVFYLQARRADGTVSFRLEKQQVLALAEYLEGMLVDLPDPAAAADVDLDLVEPIDAEWIIGSLGVAYSEADDRILVWAEQLVEGEDPEVTEEAATARFRLRREQVAPFVTRAREIVGAGRPPCPYCGRPLNDDASFCPCYN